MFGFIGTPEWEEYLRSHGYDPAAFATGAAYAESMLCELCQQDIGDDVHVVLEPPPGLIVRRKFHGPCLISHLLAHLDDPDDEISNYLATRKPSSP